MHGLPFSLTLMFILLSHEMGHYLYARHYRVYATPPFFVPFPSLIGTLGAFIRIKSPIPNRGRRSLISELRDRLRDLSLHARQFSSDYRCRIRCRVRRAFGSSSRISAGFRSAPAVAAGSCPLASLSLHPIAVAGWVGMFATALNLLPGGQLDGGHILISVSPKMHRWTTLGVVVALVPLAKYCWIGWFLWAVVLG